MSDAITPFEPQSIEQALSLAKTLALSSLLPKTLQQKPSDVLIVLMTGRELGLGPMQAIRGIHVVEGKAVMSADLMVALVVTRRDVCEYFRLVESTPQRATYKTKRVGSDDVSISFTIEDANRAKLTGKSNWVNYPAAMLRARAASALARAVYPDLFLGVYDPDELAVAPPHDSTPPLPPVAVEREVNPAPQAILAARTEALKTKLATKLKFTEVLPGETIAEADARTKAETKPVEPTLYERITILADEFGLEPTKVGSIIRGATGKQKKEQLTEDDVGKVRDSLQQLQKAKAFMESQPTPAFE